MEQSLPDDRLEVLREYAAGRLGTREAIERAGLDDYGDLLVAMARNGLDLPRPRSSAIRDAHIARATAILQPLLRRHGN